ncbi:LOW QUALITY PROTEIN: nuclear factor related to kappa-B-binding protein-like [Dermacentor silvarum]|uniref:LOW QUALITY PROTEIN: nuclear factor related to kappa-B-binding protein-like n=1 Tax=Dermacentor silvarum TaxID=543639 RepID=UPI00210182BE|nr:LOW QUALITY PROTEIN: nuclear factor related to kappa-B-binding protein-like [Dermacentor silvarum]
MERCLLGSQVVQLPQALCEQEALLRAVLSIDTWNNVLSEAHKMRLMEFLPNFGENDKEEKVETLQRLFSGCNFKFGNPIHCFFLRLRDGLLVPDIARTASLVRKASYRDYRLNQRRYHCRLLQDILVSRKRLLDACLDWGPWGGVPRPIGGGAAGGCGGPRQVPLAQRTRWRYCTELQELRDRLGEPRTSDEDDLCSEGGGPPKLLRKYRRQVHHFESALSPELNRVPSTLAAGPQGPHRCDTSSGRFLSKCLTLSEITEERFRDMLLAHRQKRLAGLNTAELDTSSVTLEEVISRTNLSRRPQLRPQDGRLKRPRVGGAPPSSVAPVVASSPPPATPAPPSPPPVPSSTAAELLLPAADSEEDEEEEATAVEPPSPVLPPRGRPASPPAVQQPSCFFALLRDLFNETAEQKMSATKLEERVKTWSHSTGAQQVEWFGRRDSWPDMVSSALRFLAGDYIGLLPEDFVPYLDYKEKQQQWQWIGAGRDSDTQTHALCQHWLQGREPMDALEASQGSPPPPKSTTDWTVRPTTDHERSHYRTQECVRYQNPHRAFTFRVHGYEAVVGPVKGVYGKESGVNKAREHSLLVSDRPPFVTILSLVRDAAARLPNGEGTRADICELLKDSQYLAEASDQQIHTVVSGALDRLHYEKDPCVKYDVNRKLWIYLHRCRTEEEFEKIHQAQAAAAKAKKAIQKNKLPRLKSKESPKAAEPENDEPDQAATPVAPSTSASEWKPPSCQPAGPHHRPRLSPPHQKSPRLLSPSWSKGFQTIVIKQEPKNKPVMARLVSGSQQVVCNLVGGSPRPALRIQGAPFLPAPRLITVAQQGPPATATPMLLATQPTVVLANQSGSLKSSPAYVMGTTGPPGTAAMVVGGQPLKGIKVIPVPPRGARPLLARLIGPPPAGLRAVHPTATTNTPVSSSSLIVQVQQPQAGEGAPRPDCPSS